MFPSRQGGTLKPEKRESCTMSCQGVYFRMHDDARSKPFRNRAQILVSEKSLIYSAFPMPGKSRRTEIPITWLQESGFIVDWSRVCRHWSKAATCQQHMEHGVRGLLEQGLHFWRYDPAATQEMQRISQSYQRRTPESSSVPSPWPSTSAPDDDAATRKMAPSSSTTAYLKPHTISRPALYHDPYGLPKGSAISSPWPGASTRDGDVPTTKTPASSEPTKCPKVYKICQRNFDPTEYGSEDMQLTVGDRIRGVSSSEESADWAYGRKVLADHTLSEPGWYPRAFAQ